MSWESREISDLDPNEFRDQVHTALGTFTNWKNGFPDDVFIFFP